MRSLLLILPRCRRLRHRQLRRVPRPARDALVRAPDPLRRGRRHRSRPPAARARPRSTSPNAATSTSPTSIAEGRMTFHSDNAAGLPRRRRARALRPGAARPPSFTTTATASSSAPCRTATPAGATRSASAACASTPTAAAPAPPAAPPGASCVKTGGTPDVTCDPSVHFCGDDGTCQHKVHEGQPCVADEQLPVRLRLRRRQVRPTRARPAGQRLRHRRTPPCADGLYCDETGACEPLVDAGGHLRQGRRLPGRH